MYPLKRWLSAVLLVTALLAAGVLAPGVAAADPVVHVVYFYSPT
jgi:hypothetical protein